MSKQQLTSPWETDHNDFDCKNIDPETLKKWKTESRRKNLRDMRSYLKQFPDATPEEKEALRSWVRCGHSPYENGDYIANDSGELMDFINALRFMEDEYQEYLKDPEGYRGCPDEIVSDQFLFLESDGVDLPF